MADDDIICGFTPADAKRVGRVVKFVEKQSPFTDQQRRQNVYSPQSLYVINTSGEIVPSYGVMAVKAFNQYYDAGFVEIEKPSATFRGDYLFNGIVPIGIGESGLAQAGPLYLVSYDTGASPAVMDGFGVKPGSWLLWKGYPTLIYVRGLWDSTSKILHGEYRPIKTLLGKTQQAVSAGAMATDGTDWLIMQGAAGSETDAGFTDPLPALYTHANLDDNKIFLAHWVNNQWEVATGSGGGGGSTIIFDTLSADMAYDDAEGSVTSGDPGDAYLKHVRSCSLER